MFHKDLFEQTNQRLLDNKIQGLVGLKNLVEQNIDVIKDALDFVVLFHSGEASYTKAQQKVHKAVSAANVLYCQELSLFLLGLEHSDDIEWEFSDLSEIEMQRDTFNSKTIPEIKSSLSNLA